MVIKRKGFTLIELMIVVAVIGILVAIAIVKYGDMIRKTRDANAKSSLGSLRSALTIYYSDNEGYFPVGTVGDNQTTLADNLVPKYFKEVPALLVFPYHNATNTVDNTPDRDFFAADATDDGEWVYVSVENTSAWGSLAIECYHADTKGTIWTSY